MLGCFPIILWRCSISFRTYDRRVVRHWQKHAIDTTHHMLFASHQLLIDNFARIVFSCHYMCSFFHHRVSPAAEDLACEVLISYLIKMHLIGAFDLPTWHWLGSEGPAISSAPVKMNPYYTLAPKLWWFKGQRRTSENLNPSAIFVIGKCHVIYQSQANTLHCSGDPFEAATTGFNWFYLRPVSWFVVFLPLRLLNSPNASYLSSCWSRRVDWFISLSCQVLTLGFVDYDLASMNYYHYSWLGQCDTRCQELGLGICV